MAAILVCPQECHISGHIINRFYNRGGLFIASPEPQISSTECKWDRWFRFPKYNTVAIDQQELAEKTSEMVQAIATHCIENRCRVDDFIIFPNLSYNHNFLTVTYESLLETFSSNVVVPVSILGGVYEYQVASPVMRITVLRDSRSGQEAHMSCSALLSSVKTFIDRDVTNLSKNAVVRAFSFNDGVDENWIDVFCESFLEKRCKI